MVRSGSLGPHEWIVVSSTRPRRGRLMPYRLEPQLEPIPGYRLIERLGGGGFGEVWKAEAPGGLHKAIKFVYGNLEHVDSADTVRASQELRSLERVKNVRHPFVLSLERYEIINGQLIIVTELADGSLWDRFREYRSKGMPGIPRQELLGYLTEAAEALDLMNHQYDLMHLDVKPQNLFLVHNHVKVADFGLVKELEGMMAAVTGGITPVYAAPETFDGYVSRNSDQYSLAIVYQELLTGYRPFSGTNSRQLILQHLEGKPKLDPLPPQDRPVVAKALNRDPKGRFTSCGEFIQTLKTVGEVARSSPNLFIGGETVTDHQGPTSTSHGGSEPPVARLEPAPATAHQPPNAAPLTVPPTAPSSSGYLSDGKVMPTPQSRPVMSATPRPPRPEQTGPGLLVPALVVGLGGLGRLVMNQIRQDLISRHGSLANLPHLRFLTIDTDAEVPPLVTAMGLAGTEELINLKLNRPARYLRPRDTLPPVEQWLDTNILYRMPRTLETSGIRAFGRLAFVEYARSVAARIRRELEAATSEEALKTAEQHTGYGLRSSFPHVYLVASLGGGTGSGMFLDLAYVVKQQLRDLGFDRPDVFALLLLPHVDDHQDADMPQANAHAALRELNHFQVAGQSFHALYETGADPLTDDKPPFRGCFLVPQPDPRKEEDLLEAVRTAANFIHRSLLSPLGRNADETRAHTQTMSPFSSPGLRLLASPRRHLVRRTAKRLALKLLELWTQPCPPELHSHIHQALDDYFRREGLDPAGLATQLDAACAHELGQPVQQYLANLVAPFRQLPEGFPSFSAINEAFKAVDDLLGSTREAPPTSSMAVPRLIRVLAEGAERLIRHGGPPFIASLYTFIDRPGYRIAAAEEAVKLAINLLDAAALMYEDQAKQYQHRGHEKFEKLRGELQEFDRLKRAQDRKRAAALPPPGDKMYEFFLCRYQALLCERVAGILISLRGYCADQPKELRFCRNRLTDLMKSLRDENEVNIQAFSPKLRMTSSVLLPRGCRTLVQAVTDFLDTVTGKDLHDFDLAVQGVLQRTLPPLAELCVTPGDALRPVRATVLQEAERYLEKRISLQDAASLFLERQPDEQAVGDSLLTTYDETLPLIMDQRLHYTKEFGIMVLPESTGGYQLRALVQQTLPDVQVVLSDTTDEVMMYREVVGIPLHDLKLMGAKARAAYETALQIEHFTPHCRQDVTNWIGPN
jgi:serine/threonine protein kinase